MGILNVTPDSFSDGGLHLDPQLAIQRGLQMIEEGADLIDVGGESTRPGAVSVDVSIELDRTIPVVEALAQKGVHVSIDTRKPAVARAALDAGAFLINDVSGLRDPEMIELVEARKPTVCIMHMQGDPETMQVQPVYEDVVSEVFQTLLRFAANLKLPQNRIWLDPGIGFGKTVDHNLTLIQHLDELTQAGFPVLIGVSRKGFIGKVLGSNSPDDRLEGTLATQVIAQMKGAKIIRAHDVKEAARTIRMTAAVRNGSAQIEPI